MNDQAGGNRRKPSILLINTISAAFQTLAYVILIAILYRYIIDKLGVTKLGVWSIVLSTTSLAGLSNTGINSASTKYISHYLALNDYIKISSIINTSLIIMAAISLFFCFFFYFTIYYSIPFFIKTAGLIALARSLLPYGFISLFITGIASVYLSCIDGLHKVYLRSLLLIVSTVCYILLSIYFINRYELKGLAYAQIIQAAIILFGSLLILKKQLPKVSILSFNWNRQTFSELFKYSTKIQFTTLLQILTEPLMKLLLSKFGNIQITAFYDMALKIVNGIRSLIVAGSQAMIPEIARLKSLDRKSSMWTVFEKGHRLVLFLSILIFPSLAGLSLLISKIWLGHIEYTFINITIMVCAGYFLNIISVPVYFFNISTGNLTPNTSSAIYSTITNVLLGFLLGYFFNSYGVIMSWILGSAVGTLILFKHVKTLKNELNILLGPAHIKTFIVISAISAGVFIFSRFFAESSLRTTVAVSLLIYLSVLIILYTSARKFSLLDMANFKIK